ncbi:MAG: hypothetical protein RLZZ127_1345 [Planctomycetota bacterium]|jgi:hypothetical protein
MAVVTVLALWAALRPRTLPPPPIPRSDAVPWMAEALPGVGHRTAATVAAQIRDGEPIKPARAASAAAAWFR